MTARVTVGLPVFNGERFLAETIRSVLDQTFGDLELVIADNGSTDGTEAICRGFAAGDSRVRYHRSEVNRGAAWNYNRLVGLATSPYFTWQAADDVLRPEFLARCIAVLDARPEVALAYTAAEYIDADGRHRRFHRNPDGYGVGASPGERVRSAMRVTTHCFEVFGVVRLGQLRQTRLIGAYPASDLVLLAELALLGEFAQVSEPLFRHRMHKSRSVRQHADRRDLVRWYSTGATRLAAPRWRLLLEYARAFGVLPVPWPARTAALLTLPPWMLRHRLQLAYDVAALLPPPVAARAREVRDCRRGQLMALRVVARGDDT